MIYQRNTKVQDNLGLKMALKSGVAAASLLVIAGSMNSAAAQSMAGGGGIEEIVVSAQKRDQALSDLGMTVNVLSADDILTRRVTQVEELANIVPGFSFTRSNTTAPVFTLRGVGFFDNGISAYPTVSVYMDEAPLPFSVMAQNISFDLERVEVLKGPQGTYFGNNATGGALNFIAAKPTEEFSAGMTLGYGRFNEKRVDGFVSGPITDTLRGRLAFQWINSDEWQKDHVTGAETGAADVSAFRGILDWEPTERLRAQLTVNAWWDTSDPQAAQYVAFSPQEASAPPTAMDGYPTTPPKPRLAGFSSALRPNDDDLSVTTEPFMDNRLFQAALRFDFDITSDITLTSLSSYAEYKQFMALSRDGVALENFDLPVVEGDIESISQEIRLANSGDAQFRWMLGANYSEDDVFENYTMAWADSTTRAAFDPPMTGRSGYRTAQDMENWAVFANAEYDIADFTLKGGIRYTETNRFGAGCNYDVPGYGIAEFFTGLSQITRTVLGLPPSPLSQVQPGGCSLIDTVGIEGNPPSGLPLEDRRSVDEDNISWRVGVDWRATDDVLFYANVAKGYKAGSIPGAPSTFNEQYVEVVQESVQSYEVGLKSTLMNDRVSANLAGFYYDYKNKQLRTRYVNSVFGLLDRLQNVPKSEVTGFEAELTFRPVDGLSLYANYIYLDTEIKEFFGVDENGVDTDFAGSKMPFAPKHQFTVGGQYDWAVTDSLYMFAGADYNYRSNTTAIVGETQTFRIDSYGTLDLRLGIQNADETWRLWAWGKNVTNEYYWNNVSDVFDTTTRYAGRPATYGIALSYRY